jgi:GNAT superfamily N-acetyltransferase
MTIQFLVQQNPQVWTVTSILNHHYGKILLSDSQRVCLNITHFFILEGPFLKSFADELIPHLTSPAIITASNHDWYDYLMNTLPFKRMTRNLYQWNPHTNNLTSYLTLKSEYQIHRIDEQYAMQINTLEWAEGVFDSYVNIADFLQRGFGYCILDQEKIISLCLSFADSSYGVEIEVDTDPLYQGQGLGKVVSAHFIAEALRRNITPLWDASNVASAKIAEALGFEFVREYESILLEG